MTGGAHSITVQSRHHHTPPAPMLYHRILVYYDGSRTGKRAFHAALDLARTHEAELFVVCVALARRNALDVEDKALVEHSLHARQKQLVGLRTIAATIEILRHGAEDRAKASYVRRLGRRLARRARRGGSCRHVQRTRAGLVAPAAARSCFSAKLNPNSFPTALFLTKISDIIAVHADLRIPLHRLRPPG